MTEHMTDAEILEHFGGADARHRTRHTAKAVSAEQRVYILHSWDCKNNVRDLRSCPYSAALDHGIDIERWAPHEDKVVFCEVIYTYVGPELVPSKETL